MAHRQRPSWLLRRLRRVPCPAALTVRPPPQPHPRYSPRHSDPPGARRRFTSRRRLAAGPSSSSPEAARSAALAAASLALAAFIVAAFFLGLCYNKRIKNNNK